MMIRNMGMIPFSIPQIDTNYLKAITSSLRKKNAYEGNELQCFEKAFCEFIGVKYAITFSSARYGLFLLYKFFGCQGKKVVFPSYTCIPALDALRWAKGDPLFCDIDPGTYNPVLPKEFNPSFQIGAVTLSYLYGLVGDIEPLLKFARDRAIPLIEDAAIALGLTYKGKKAGSLGDAAVFSLQSSKIITAWKGGVITTNNESLYKFLVQERNNLPYPSYLKLIFNLLLTYLRGTFFSDYMIYRATLLQLRKLFSSKFVASLLAHLFNQDPSEAMTAQSSRLLPGYERVRFTNLQAVIALASLDNIERIIERRRFHAKIFYEGLGQIEGVSLPQLRPECAHVYGRYPIRIKGYSKEEIRRILDKDGIEAATYYPYICPDTHYYKGLYADSQFPNARKAAEETVLLPFHNRLRETDIRYITNRLARIKSEVH